MYIQVEPLKQEERKALHICLNCGVDSGKCWGGVNPCKKGCPIWCFDCNTDTKREKTRKENGQL